MLSVLVRVTLCARGHVVDREGRAVDRDRDVSGPVEQFVAVPVRSIDWPAQAWPGHTKLNWTHGFGAQFVVQLSVAAGVVPQLLVPTAEALCSSPWAVQAPMVNVRVRETDAPAATPGIVNGVPSIVIVMSSASAPVRRRRGDVIRLAGALRAADEVDRDARRRFGGDQAWRSHDDFYRSPMRPR
jgi:hypothetical protein